MASESLLMAEQAMIESLTAEEIPIKLRCAVCSKLAINAVRLPCCDQSVCESCHSRLASTCPKCEHSPITADDCKPNKALRTTIKVFLRSTVKKRDLAKATALPAASAESVDALTTPGTQRPSAENTEANTCTSTDQPMVEAKKSDERIAELVASANVAVDKAPEDIPQPSIEKVENGQELDEAKLVKDEAAADAAANVEKNSAADREHRLANTVTGTTVGANGQWAIPQMTNNMSLGMHGMAPSYGNMAWNGPAGFDPSMQGGWGSYPNMMGVPGMMDPMAMSQGMYGGYGGQGIGMYGMNGMNGMNMIGGFGYGADQGAYGGWNGQWSGGQEDNMNPNTHGGAAHGMGDFGYNSRYHQNSAGGRYHGNQLNQQYGSLPYQSGTGFGQRPGHHASSSGPSHGQTVGDSRSGGVGNGIHQPNVSHQQLPSYPSQATVNSYAPSSIAVINEGEAEGQLANTTDEGKVETEIKAHANGVTQNDDDLTTAAARASVDDDETGLALDAAAKVSSEDGPIDGTTVMPAQTDVPRAVGDNTQVPSIPYIQAHADQSRAMSLSGRGGLGPRAALRGAMSGIRGGRGAPVLWSNGNGALYTAPTVSSDPSMIPLVQVLGVGVIGAPRAPKALREGLPNTSIRSRGLSIVGRAGIRTNGAPHATVVTQISPQFTPHEKSQSPEKDELPSRSRSRSKSRSKSRSTERRQSRRPHHHHHHRSQEAFSEGESKRSKKGHHSRRSHHNHQDESSPEPATKGGIKCEIPREASHTRSPDASSTKRTSHHSHHDESRSSMHGSRSHRTRRDRNRSGGRDRDSERRHRHRTRSPSKEATADEADETASRPHRTSSHRHRHRDRDHDRERDRDRDRARSRDDRPSRGEHAHPSATRDEKATRHTHRVQEDPPTPHSSRPPRPNPNPNPTPVPEVNTHDRERAERNRERLLREQQRIAELNGESSTRRLDLRQRANKRPGTRESDHHKHHNEDENEDERASKRRRKRSGDGGEGIEVKGRGGRRYRDRYEHDTDSRYGGEGDDGVEDA